MKEKSRRNRPEELELHIGDRVWIEGEVIGLPSSYGDVRIRVSARPGYRASRATIHHRFLRLHWSNGLRRRWQRLVVFWKCRVLRHQGPPCQR